MATGSKRAVATGDGDLFGRLAGEYRILHRLGSGGFGTVYAAEHPVLKRTAAVKVLHANPDVDSIAVQRFIEEARSASQIRHRHIVDIFSFGTLPNGQYFYVMDLLEGAPLDRYLSEHTRLAPSAALPLLRPIASAIDALHAAALVHRDLKPANIFLAWDSNQEVVPKLLDFGLVKLLGSPSLHTQSGVPIGTPYYMSPEQCQGAKLDARADIYSFGVICFELLAGKPPFSGESVTSVLIAHVVQPPPRLSECAPELPAALDEPLAQMLAKDPEARPASASAAVHALIQAAERAGIEVPPGPPSLPPPARPPISSLEADTTVARSGVQAGLGYAARPASRSRWWWAALAGLLVLAWFAGELYRERGALEPALESSQPSATQPSSPLAAPASAPSASSSRAPASPAPVSITLRDAPAGAEVWLDDLKLGPASSAVLLPYGEQPLSLSLRVPGQTPRTLQVTPNSAQELAFPSAKPSRAPGRRSALPRDLENPF